MGKTLELFIFCAQTPLHRVLVAEVLSHFKIRVGCGVTLSAQSGLTPLGWMGPRRASRRDPASGSAAIDARPDLSAHRVGLVISLSLSKLLARLAAM